MRPSVDPGWLRMVILLGIVYLVAGVTFGTLAGWAGSDRVRILWRLAAWVASAAAFAAHIAYEFLRLRSSPRTTALHVAMAVSLGALALAIVANLHGIGDAGSNHRLLAIALVAWPVLCGLPAFLVALAAAGALALTRRSG